LARKILLADDSVTAQNMGRKILADAGYEVSTVNNGSAALKRVAEARPDVIVLDVYMPGYSGLEVCLRLKEASETARIPILLTVGKLEPFKPEEAKRARADAFIVKPFEASELLSALSKLEDKIVPLPEPPKPGRFARAIAAVEEGRYDKEDTRRDKSAAADEDSGWKERISFPSKKKKKAVEPEDVDDPALYNPVNKDLRTVVERKPAPAPAPPPASPDDTRVDLGALSLQGLPQDVTPQEIAAIAAAAARMTGTFAANEGPESPAAEAKAAEVSADRAPEPAPQPSVAIPEAPKVEEKLETKPEPVETLKEAAAPVTEAVAEQKAEKKESGKEKEKRKEKETEKETEKVEVPAEKPAEPAPEPRSGLAYPSSPDLTGAIVALPLGTYVSLSPGAGTASGNGSSASVPESEPVTMAAAAGTEIAAAPSRWMAVPVTLAPEEAALSLEQEMQKAHAAFAAAEAAHAAPAPAIPEAPIALVEPAPATEISAPVEAATAEPLVPFDAPPVPSLVQSMGAVASQAAEAIRAAVKEFENVAASVKEKISSPSEPEPAPAVTAQAEAQPAPEVPAPVEAKVEPAPVVEEKAPEPEVARQQEAPQPVPQAQTEEKKEEPQPAAEPAAVAAVEPVAAAPAELSSGPEVSKVSPPVVSEVPAEPVLASQDSAQITEVSAPSEPAAGGNDDMAKKEKEIADSTAAAWASWRRIRDTDAKGRPSETEEEAPPQEEAAMAAAAGAEKAPGEVPAEGESDEIASIVDSVLADMRPKIVQEISKKLGKKKK
jgi:CheY-like chemotaxis protein